MTNENADNAGAQNTDTGTQQDATTTPAAKADGATDAPATDAAAAADSSADTGAKDGEVKADKGQDEGKKDEPKKLAPEKYEFKAPEGVNVDDAVTNAFSEVARELDLPNDAAQKILEKMAPVIAGRQSEALTLAKADWLEQAKADKEFGGAKFDENLAAVAKARDAFANPELRKLLDDTGLGNHPEVIRWFYRAGKNISEDTVVTNDNSNAEKPKDAASVMFPNMNKKSA